MYEVISALFFIAFFIKIYFFDKKKRLLFFTLAFFIWFVASFYLPEPNSFGLTTSKYFIWVVWLNFALMFLIQKKIDAKSDQKEVALNKTKQDCDYRGFPLLCFFAVTTLLFVLFIHITAEFSGGKTAKEYGENIPVLAAFLFATDSPLLLNRKFSWAVFSFLLIFSVFCDLALRVNGFYIPVAVVCLFLVCLIRIILWAIRRYKEKQ